MNRRRGAVWPFALAAVMLGLVLWLFTLDSYADHGRLYTGESEAEGTQSFCGSAYDVALLRGDGFMGGEVPENQDLLNKECVTKASQSVAMATASAVTGIALVCWGMGRTRRKRPVGRELGETATTAVS